MVGDPQHIVVTGGAGYIGSLLTGVLLQRGYRVTVVDNLLFGGESLLGYWWNPHFRFVRADVSTLKSADLDALCGDADGVVHLAALVGFPACEAAGRRLVWRCNVKATERLYEAASRAGVRRFLFASTYSNYGWTPPEQPATEASPLYPQSLYAESKIEAERRLIDRSRLNAPVVIIFRLATLFGISPRTRFDLLVNQFVLEAVTERRLVVYEGSHRRSFVHVADVVGAVCLALGVAEAKVRGQIFNVGSEAANYTKEGILRLIKKHLPETEVHYKDVTVPGDMRDITVSFVKVRDTLGFVPRISIEQGIVEVRDALRQGLISGPFGARHRNADFIVP